MDRTLIAPWKAEEKELSEKLHKKLQGLTLLATPTEEFRKCLSAEMFLKPNQQAFFQVMHFLFRLLDPAEFKRRFFWPITDKRSESIFRSSTVEYLKHLNEKHNLQWTNIKSYLVVMPGGMKFITFMLELVGFVIQELIVQRQKQILATDMAPLQEVTRSNLERMKRQNMFFKEYAAAYITQVDSHIVKLEEKTLFLRQQLEAIAEKTNVPVETLIDDDFLQEFEAHNVALFRDRWANRTKKIKSVESQLKDLGNVLQRFQTEQAEFKADRNAANETLLKMNEVFAKNQPQQWLSTPRSGVSDDLDMNALIGAFNRIYPTISTTLASTDDRCCTNDFVHEELQALRDDFVQIESQITDFQKMLNNSRKYQSFNLSTPAVQPPGAAVQPRSNENLLATKYICTPPIKFEISESGANTRLCLLDDIQQRTRTDCNYMGSPVVLRSARKPKHADNFDLSNTTMNRSKIIDPLHLLRTISKDTTRVRTRPQDLSGLGAKWHDRQCLFGQDISSGVVATPKKTNTVGQKDLLSPYTPFGSNDRTRIARPQFLETSGSLFQQARKGSVVSKVKDDSLNLHNLSTSPSGRLESLVAFTAFDFPTPVAAVTKAEPREETPTTPVAGKLDQPLWNENDQNVVNRNAAKFTKVAEDDEDSLFNTSDTVLKEIGMEW